MWNRYGLRKSDWKQQESSSRRQLHRKLESKDIHPTQQTKLELYLKMRKSEEARRAGVGDFTLLSMRAPALPAILRAYYLTVKGYKESDVI